MSDDINNLVKEFRELQGKVNQAMSDIRPVSEKAKQAHLEIHYWNMSGCGWLRHVYQEPLTVTITIDEMRCEVQQRNDELDRLMLYLFQAMHESDV